MCAQLENWKDLADDVENAVLAAAASQEATSNSESTANESVVSN